MNNAAYHSVEIDKAPTLATRKEEMLDWLVRHGVQADPTLTREPCLVLLKISNPGLPHITWMNWLSNMDIKSYDFLIPLPLQCY
ncbi:hypothetical protein ANN_24252 [Periplaneta americana]|uniref:Uncharacterized protein n=1 Tax=Periplaneta americana TaxID=6978 RepID=A0ABQ8S3A8_PERAM|nr:hypothetical protein ANN_24252 [Periplaneta americana]